ncbi:MAG: metal-dependent transcriptional regulator [Chloroflexota bacterium]|nr:MAG: metal-dependent transcriptional regulator [Chloroflexota bacterium]
MTQPSEREVTRSVQDYLKTIYKLQGDGPVQTSALAEQMRVAPPSATNMVARLAEAGFLRHTPYKGAELTDAGAGIALEVIRHHRLWELFLHRALGVPIDRLHDEAERLEHELSDELEERIARALGEPTLDPHGDPIPSREGEVDATAFPALADLPIGMPAIIRRVPDNDPGFLRYLESLDLLPGATVAQRAREPFRGPITLDVGGVERVIGYELASRVRVEAVTTKA